MMIKAVGWTAVIKTSIAVDSKNAVRTTVIAEVVASEQKIELGG